MKFKPYPMRLLALLVSTIVLASCGGGGEELTPEEKTVELLVGKGSTTKTWSLQSVDVDGVDQTDVYSGLTIKFTEGGYIATNGGTIWPASGTWTFSSGSSTTIKRDDGTTVELLVTEDTLQLTLTWTKTTFGPGRVSSVSGLHKFKLVKV